MMDERWIFHIEVFCFCTKIGNARKYVIAKYIMKNSLQFRNVITSKWLKPFSQRKFNFLRILNRTLSSLITFDEICDKKDNGRAKGHTVKHFGGGGLIWLHRRTDYIVETICRSKQRFYARAIVRRRSDFTYSLPRGNVSRGVPDPRSVYRGIRPITVRRAALRRRFSESTPRGDHRERQSRSRRAMLPSARA